jgi:hypothetical protein
VKAVPPPDPIPVSRSPPLLRVPAALTRPAVRLTLVLVSVVPVSGRVEAAEGSGTLRLATCQFPVSADVRANGEWDRTQMRQAGALGADLIHFPECALSGYAGAVCCRRTGQGPPCRRWQGGPVR